MISASDEHPKKTEFPIAVTEYGIVTLVSDKQFLNISFSIFRKSPVIVNDFIPLNILDPNEVTEEGIVISASDEHSLKAELPIEVTEEGIVIWTNDEHPLKAEFPIEVIEDGIAICDKDEHPLNAKSPIDLTEDGIAIFCELLFPLKSL